MKSLILIALTVFSFSAWAQSGSAQNNQDLFDRESLRIANQYQENKITRLMAAKEVLAASKAYFPNDRVAHDYYQSLVEYSELRAKNQISEKKLQELFSSRTERFIEAQKDRAELNERNRRQEELEQNRINQAKAEAYNEAVRQQNNVAAGAAALQGIGRAFNNSFGQSITPPPQICSYYGNTRYCY